MHGRGTLCGPCFAPSGAFRGFVSLLSKVVFLLSRFSGSLARPALSLFIFVPFLLLPRLPLLLRVRGVAITYSVRLSGGGTDSFHGFEYCGLITLASREFQVLIAFLPTSLRCLRIFGFVSVAWCCGPTFIAYPHGLLS